ncbi:DUF6769 family protein [Phocaeicola sp.]
MKRRRYIAWALMLVSIIMLTASVLPHHHHQEILCLQHDVTACGCECSDHHHNETPGEKHTCNAGCVTKFKSVTPDKSQDSVSPDYSFCSLMYTLTDILILPLRPSESKTKLYTYYLERLHSTCFPHVIGLRAPPYVLA